jgi:low temperature requirement protein LtrA
LSGALVFAAGIPSFQHGDRTVGVTGYVIMRLALVTLWLRAARADPPRRLSARRYALGVSVVQVAWVALLFAPRSVAFSGFWVLCVAELLVPAWAERAARTPWHREHLAERYGLFTLISLGESILAASIAVRSATEGGATALSLLPILIGGLLIVFAFWWLYFERPGHELLTAQSAFVWGYGHYFVFGAAAAVGAGLAVAIDHATRQSAISSFAAGASVAVPAAVYLASLAWLHARDERSVATRVVAPVVIVLVLLSPFTGQAVLCTGLLMAALTAFKIVQSSRALGGKGSAIGS